jgi:serine/threonine protein phosphatase PrpC
MTDTSWTSAALTHPGRVRDHNEDTFGLAEEDGFWCVADGMGGHAGGDVASAIARDVILSSIRDGEGVKTSILAAHDSIVRSAEEGEGPPQMGSTIVALRSTGRDYLIAWVGDSRAYLWNGNLRRLSRDHSLVEDMIDSGAFAEDSPEAAEIRNVITQCLGPPNKTVPRVDTVTGNWQAGDKIVLCSDGMHGELSDDIINGIIDAQQDAGDQAIVGALVDAALQAGGSDNITVVVVSAPKVLPYPAMKAEREEGTSGSGWLLFAVIAASALLLFYLL